MKTAIRSIAFASLSTLASLGLSACGAQSGAAEDSTRPAPTTRPASGARLPVPDKLSPASATNTSKLTANEMLSAGQSIVSPSCAYHLDMQGDGNLVLYAGFGTASPLWASNTAWSPDPSSTVAIAAVMQADGNFVIYSGINVPAPADQAAAWSTNTQGKPGAFLSLQDDGNLVLYDGTAAAWASNTAGSSLGQTCQLHSSITHVETSYNAVGLVASVKSGMTMTQCAAELGRTCQAVNYDGEWVGINLTGGTCTCVSRLLGWQPSTAFTSFWKSN